MLIPPKKGQPKPDVIYFAKALEDLEVFGTKRKFLKGDSLLIKELEMEEQTKTVYLLDGKPFDKKPYYVVRDEEVVDEDGNTSIVKTRGFEIPEEIQNRLSVEKVTVPNIWKYVALIDMEDYEGKERPVVKGWGTIKKDSYSKIEKTSDVKITKYPNFKKVKAI